MSYAVTIGSVEAVWIDSKPTPPGCVRYEGDLPSFPIWDAGLNNIRAMTQAEKDALPAQLQAASDARNPDLATIRDNATAAFNSNATYLAIASPGNAQVAAQVRALTQQNQQIIKALARLAIAAIS